MIVGTTILCCRIASKIILAAIRGVQGEFVEKAVVVILTWPILYAIYSPNSAKMCQINKTAARIKFDFNVII